MIRNRRERGDDEDPEPEETVLRALAALTRCFLLVPVLAAALACETETSNPGASGCVQDCGGGSVDPNRPNGHEPDSGPQAPPARSDDGIQNGTETDVDCGGANAPKCAEGKRCQADDDCLGACDYKNQCIDIPSCKQHLGGDTCGKGDVGDPGAQHESCCRTLPVKGYVDKARPDKKVFLDKYEITTGRVRAFLADISRKYDGVPNVRDWVRKNTPVVWDASWTRFLPADVDGEVTVIDRRLLGDPRGTWPGAPPPPATDEARKTGTDFQFNESLFVYLHGNNCSTRGGDSWGWPTWFYPAAVLTKMGPEFLPRADGFDHAGHLVPASEHLEVKSMNCITNALLQAFCHWDGGQLATSEVLDYVTASPPSLGDRPGCGSQVAEDPPRSDASMKGGRCADLALINASYDAGATLPEPGSPLNAINYEFPLFTENTTHDKAWQIAAPGRGTFAANGEAADTVRIDPDDEPWMDLAGNLSEAVLTTVDGAFTGRFGLKYRGMGYQSARSKLNADPKWDDGNFARLERAEAKAAFTGGRCMRFR